MADLMNDARYVAPPSDADRTGRLAVLGLKPEDVQTPPVIVRSGEEFVFSADNPAAKLWIRPAPVPTSLDELKELAGVPNRVFERANNLSATVHEDVAAESLEHADIVQLSDASSLANRVATNLVYGYADPALVANEPHASLVRTMIAALGGQNVVAGNDLIVDDGATVDLGPNPVVTFDRIIIHGSGRIKVHDKQKVTAGSVQWLPN